MNKFKQGDILKVTDDDGIGIVEFLHETEDNNFAAKVIEIHPEWEENFGDIAHDFTHTCENWEILKGANTELWRILYE